MRDVEHKFINLSFHHETTRETVRRVETSGICRNLYPLIIILVPFLEWCQKSVMYFDRPLSTVFDVLIRHSHDNIQGYSVDGENLNVECPKEWPHLSHHRPFLPT